jgi:uncharacterized delta-60 repeat protein
MKNFRSQTTRRAHGIVRVFLAIVAMALLVSWNFPVNVEALAGDLDPAFGSGGKVTTDMGRDEGGLAIALQPDGKVIVAGWAESKKKGRDFAVARYNRDGSLDSSFGTDGVAGYDFDRGDDVATAVAIQSDGKIVVAGYAYSDLSQSDDFGLVRFNSDGSLDSSFGSGGQVLLDFYGLKDAVNGVAIQSDGKIIVAGYCLVSTDQCDFALARFNPDGSADTSFGSQGRVNTNLFNRCDEAYAMAIQSDGRIVLAGGTSEPITFGDFGLARYNSDGTLDLTFGTGGKIKTDFSAARNMQVPSPFSRMAKSWLWEKLTATLQAAMTTSPLPATTWMGASMLRLGLMERSRQTFSQALTMPMTSFSNRMAA